MSMFTCAILGKKIEKTLKRTIERMMIKTRKHTLEGSKKRTLLVKMAVNFSFIEHFNLNGEHIIEIVCRQGSKCNNF